MAHLSQSRDLGPAPGSLPGSAPGAVLAGLLGAGEEALPGSTPGLEGRGSAEGPSWLGASGPQGRAPASCRVVWFTVMLLPVPGLVAGHGHVVVLARWARTAIFGCAPECAAGSSS